MGLNPQDILGQMSGNWGGMLTQGIMWLGRILLGIALIGFFWGALVFMQYKYKVVLHRLEGGAISKPRWERAKLFKKKGVEQWKLLLCRKEIKPVNFEYIYKRNKVFLLRTGTDTFIPMKKEITIEKKDGKKIPKETLRPLEDDNKFWYQLQERQTADDYRPDDAAKKQMMMMFGAILLVLLFAFGVLWLAFSRTDLLIDALNSFGSQPPSWLQQTTNGVAPN